MRAAIIAQDPDAKVAMGGIGNITAGAEGSIYGLDYLKAVNHAGVYPDYLAVHAYPSKGQAPDQHIRYQNNFDDLKVIRDYQKSIDWTPPLWLTEWGWSTEDFDTAAPLVSRATQAKYVYCSLNLLATEYRYVSVATYFIDFDRASFGYGLFFSDFTSKPGANAFGKFMSDQQNAIGTDPAQVPGLVGAPPPPVGGRGNTPGAPSEARSAGIVSMSMKPSTFPVTQGLEGGGLVRFRLERPGTVHFAIQRPVAGKRVDGRCVPRGRAPKSKTHRRKPACHAWVARGQTFLQTGDIGMNKFRYRGTVGGKPLRPGQYRLEAHRPGAVRRGLARFKIIR